MKRIFAPWRIGYIQGPREKGCVFCRIGKEAPSVENLLLEKHERCFVTMNLYPYTTGHLMVIPYKHTAELSDLDPETTTEMMEQLKRWTDKVKRNLRAEGCNIGMNLGRAAGAGIADHLHMHLVPRWVGDENFMPIIGETKVLPDTLRSIYMKLTEKE